MDGEEHEYDPQPVGVEDARGVETQAAGEDLPHGELVPAHGEGVPVFEHEGHAGDHIKDIDDAQIDEHRQDVAEGEGFYLHDYISFCRSIRTGNR